MAQVFDKMRELNGLPYRTPEAKYVVSLWYIPNGTDYHAAESIDVFFVDHASADQYAAFFAMPPEMAGMMDLDRDEVNAMYSYENYGKDGKFTKYN